jgi:hypothetical protein
MKRVTAYALLVLGTLALVAPQARLGLPELRWLARFAFPGEALAGIALFVAAYAILNRKEAKRTADAASPPRHDKN